MPELERIDDTWVEASEWDGTRFTRKLIQPDRARILETIKRWRNEGVVAKDSNADKDETGWRGRWCLSIPEEDYRNFRYHPVWCELHSPDRETQQKAWVKFLAHSDSAPYRVREKAS